MRQSATIDRQRDRKSKGLNINKQYEQTLATRRETDGERETNSEFKLARRAIYSAD